MAPLNPLPFFSLTYYLSGANWHFLMPHYNYCWAQEIFKYLFGENGMLKISFSDSELQIIELEGTDFKETSVSK